jgi:tetratricopeptide (TPR) repeat protein
LLHPGDREINTQILEVALATNKWEHARDAVWNFIESGDPESKYYEVLTDIWANLDAPYNAYYYLHKWYLGSGIDDPARFIQLAGLAAQVDSFAVAEAVLDSAITRFGMNDDFLFVRAKILFHKRELSEAEDILRDLVERYGDHIDYKLNLANTLANQEAVEKKREALRIYREIRPRIPRRDMIDTLITRLEDQIG